MISHNIHMPIHLKKRLKIMNILKLCYGDTIQQAKSTTKTELNKFMISHYLKKKSRNKY